jgi:hypothetical protein
VTQVTAPLEDGLRIVDGDEAVGPGDSPDDDDDRAEPAPAIGDADLETLRDEFVDAFNARDLEAVLVLAHPDVETPDIAGDGTAVLAEELEAIWERSPGAMLTRAFLEGEACAMAWLPDEDGCWSRAALVRLDAEGGLLTVVALADDADALDRAEAEELGGEEMQEWQDWSEWDRGEETVSLPRDRPRP